MRTLLRFGLVLGMTLAATPASAQIIHSVQFSGGLFFPRGFDSRAPGDVIVENLIGFEVDGLTTALAFPEVEGCFDAFNVQSHPPSCLKGFRTGQILGEWNLGFGERIELGLGLGYAAKTVQSLYRDWEDIDGTDIRQDLRLRTIPISGVVRFLPFGRAGDFQPYAGLGIAAINWRYSESGEFLDPSTLDIFTPPSGRYLAKGTAVGPVLLGGLRLPLGGDIYALTLEGRYQWATGDTGGAAKEFVGDKIDLGGGQFNFGFLVRF